MEPPQRQLTQQDIQAIKSFDTDKGDYLRVKKVKTEDQSIKTLTTKTKGFGGRLWMQLGGSSSSIEKVAKYINRLDSESLKQEMAKDPEFRAKLEKLQSSFEKFSPLFRSDEQTKYASRKIADLVKELPPSSGPGISSQKSPTTSVQKTPTVIPNPPQFNLNNLEHRFGQINMAYEFDQGEDVSDDREQLLAELKEIQQSYKDIGIQPGPVIIDTESHEDIQSLAEVLATVKAQKKAYDEKYGVK